MTPYRARGGAVLVTVLLFSAAVWVLIAGTVVTVRMRHDVAVAALHHARARVVAMTMAERADAHDWWNDTSGDLIPASGASGQCEWDVFPLEQSPTATRYSVRATYGRAEVILEGTAVR